MLAHYMCDPSVTRLDVLPAAALEIGMGVYGDCNIFVTVARYARFSDYMISNSNRFSHPHKSHKEELLRLTLRKN